MTQSTRIAILGAGMSGICMGIELRKHGIENFVILEKADTVGGTWRENTYPGIACDVPSHVYSFSFELNPNWSHSYSGGQEIGDYCERCAAKYGLSEHLQFGKEVMSVDFNGEHWNIETAEGDHIQAEVVVSGLGGLHLPNRAKIEGIDDFSGDRFHTAQWNHDCDLTGKSVGIIGTGASAAQVLPEIADKVANVTVFQRSAAWVFPRLAAEIPESKRERFRRFPWLMRGYRWLLWAVMDLRGILSLKRDGMLSKQLRQAGLDHLEDSVADPQTRTKLTPDYAAGCKRRVISDDYLTTYNKSNVHLVTDAITQMESAGVRDETGKLHEVDVVIEATGFKPFDITDYVSINGRDNLSLQGYWAEKIETYRTMMVPGFPNMFLMLGPNSATGHTSALIMIESAAKYVIKCLQLMEEEKLTHLDPDPEAVASYNARLQGAMKDMVFGSGCNAWYTDDNDFNFTLWPYSALRFIAEQWRPKKADFGTTRAR